MAKFLCVCGTPITTSGAIPNPDEWRFISDSEFDEIPSEASADLVYDRTRSFFLCPTSGHLWVFWRGFDAPPKLYEPIDESE